jgi:hypothetical protein
MASLKNLYYLVCQLRKVLLLYTRGGQPFWQVGQIQEKKVQRANIWFKGFLAGQVLALL